MSLEDEILEALRRCGTIDVDEVTGIVDFKSNKNMLVEDIYDISKILDNYKEQDMSFDKELAKIVNMYGGAIYEKKIDKFGNATYVSEALNAIAPKNKEKIMDIKDIKPGYLVQFMSGDLAIAIPHSSGDMIFIRDDGFCVSGTQDYENIWDDDNNPRYAIDSIYGLSENCQGVFPLNTNKRELLWKRRQAISCSKCPYYLNGGEF